MIRYDLISWAKQWRKHLAGQVELMRSGINFTRTGKDDTTRDTMLFYQRQIAELDKLIARAEMGNPPNRR